MNRSETPSAPLHHPHARGLQRPVDARDESVSHRFGRFEVQPRDRTLLVDGQAAAIGGRAFDVLLALLERPGQLVGKSELLDLAWPGVVVEENNLQAQVCALRKVLGPQAIMTVAGRGYRFTLVPDSDAQADASTSSATAVPRVASAPKAPIGNLAHELPPLYGRAAEVAAVAQLLGRHGLVSIVGAGGIGKTRLAHRVAHQVRDRFKDGVWLIQLAGLSDPTRIAGAVAQILNLPVSDAGQAFAAALAAVRDKSLLLVLDNGEHMLGAVAHLAAAVRRVAPRSTVLITSQEPLRIVGEHVYRLGTLAFPPPNMAPTVDAAASYGAVELFVARARAADPRFTLNRHNVGAVVETCRRLDGIALALELAAARVPLLGVEGVCARLDERFNLLTGGARDAERRHRTLRAGLEWSHALLSDAQRAVFRRLAVFARGTCLEAAQQVAGDAAMDAWEVLDHLGALVDKSLVTASDDEPPRYRLSQTDRAYALEKLAEAGETETIARRHAGTIAAPFQVSFA